MLIDPTWLRIAGVDVVDVCRTRAWIAYSRTNPVGIPASELSPARLSYDCGSAACCCPNGPSVAQSPALTGAPWADATLPESYAAFGWLVEQATWNAIPDTCGGELTMRIVGLANTTPALSILTRWLRALADCEDCELTFQEHCPSDSVRAAVCAPGLAAPIVDTGQRIMINPELVSWSEFESVERSGQYLQTVAIVWRTRLPLITGQRTLPDQPIAVANPAPNPTCQPISQSDPFRSRYLVDDPDGYCEPSQIGDPLIFRIGCMSTHNPIAIDVTVNGRGSTGTLRNLRCELHPWPTGAPNPTLADARRIHEQNEACAEFLLGTAEAGSIVCALETRKRVVAGKVTPRRAWGTGYALRGSWRVKARPNWGFVVLVWPNADIQTTPPAFDPTPAGWKVGVSYSLSMGNV